MRPKVASTVDGTKAGEGRCHSLGHYIGLSLLVYSCQSWFPALAFLYNQDIKAGWRVGSSPLFPALEVHGLFWLAGFRATTVIKYFEDHKCIETWVTILRQWISKEHSGLSPNWAFVSCSGSIPDGPPPCSCPCSAKVSSHPLPIPPWSQTKTCSWSHKKHLVTMTASQLPGVLSFRKGQSPPQKGSYSKLLTEYMLREWRDLLKGQ